MAQNVIDRFGASVSTRAARQAATSDERARLGHGFAPAQFQFSNTFSATKTGGDLVGRPSYDLISEGFSRNWACRRSTARRHRSTIFFRSRLFAFVNSPL